MQGMELYKGKLLCYCMGNFVMDGMKRAHFGSDSLLLKCYVHSKEIKKYSFIPMYVSDQWQPTLHEPEKALAVMKKMESLSKDFGTLFTQENGEVVVSGLKAGTPLAQRGFSVEPHRGLPVLVDAPLPLPYIIKKLPGFYVDNTRS
jgi:hypothetical protein